MSNSIKTETVDGAFIVRFTRPEIRNPLSVEVLAELERILGRIFVVPKLVFTGTHGTFASGADLREIDTLSPEDAAAFSRRGQAVMERITAIRVPTVSAINGPCFGGGLDLALACDRRVASPGAAFCHPGAGLGIITGWGGTQRLPRLIGQANALEMFFTAAPVMAERALRIGLIDEIADDPLSAAVNF